MRKLKVLFNPVILLIGLGVLVAACAPAAEPTATTAPAAPAAGAEARAPGARGRGSSPARCRTAR